MVRKDKSEDTKNALLAFLESGTKPEIEVKEELLNDVEIDEPIQVSKPKVKVLKEEVKEELDDDSSSSDEEIVITRRKKNKVVKEVAPVKQPRVIEDFNLSDEEPSPPKLIQIDHKVDMLRQQLVNRANRMLF